MKLLIKLFALPCYICPLCAIARALPRSKFAKGMREFGRTCPFCIAYHKSKSTSGFH